MKTKIVATVVFVFLNYFNCTAQSVFSTNNSHVWYTHTFFISPPLNIDYRYIHYFTSATNADTLINSISYKKYFYESFYVAANNVITKDNASLLFCTRYDSASKKVYLLPKDSVNEYLYYDFSKNSGDSIINILGSNSTTSIGGGTSLQFYYNSYKINNVVSGGYNELSLLSKTVLRNNLT